MQSWVSPRAGRAPRLGGHRHPASPGLRRPPHGLSHRFLEQNEPTASKASRLPSPPKGLLAAPARCRRPDAAWPGLALPGPCPGALPGPALAERCLGSPQERALTGLCVFVPCHSVPLPPAVPRANPASWEAGLGPLMVSPSTSDRWQRQQEPLHRTVREAGGPGQHATPTEWLCVPVTVTAAHGSSKTSLPLTNSPSYTHGCMSSASPQSPLR